jgi:hypothetical protein
LKCTFRVHILEQFNERYFSSFSPQRGSAAA